VSGGYGRGGYPGQGYDAPDYDGPPDHDGRRGRDGGRDRTGPGRQDGGQQQWDGPGRRGDQGNAGYDAPPGYGGQDFGAPGYNGQGYDRGYGDQGYDPRGDPGYDPRGDAGYDPRGYGQPGGPGYSPQGQGAGPQRGQQSTGGTPEFDQHGTGPRRPSGGYDQRGTPPPGGTGGYGQAGHGQGGAEPPRAMGDWEQDQGDSSFLPGFSRRDEFDDGRPGGRPAPERDARYDYDDRRAQRRGRPDGRGQADGSGDRGGRGPGERGGAGPDPRGRDGGRDGGPRDRGDAGDRDRQPRKKATRWLPRILVLTVVAVIVIGGLVGGLSIYHKYQARYHPADYAGAGTGDVTVQVMSGDTAFTVGPRLLQLGVIASTRAFTNAAESATSTTGASSTGLEAGFYVLHQHMQASLAFTDLTNPKNRVQTTVTIPEGKRAVDVIAIIAGKTKIPLKNFQQVLAHPAQLGLPSYANGKVEGYLFPATYAVVPHETALQILQAMVQRYNTEAQQVGVVSAAKTVGLTPTQLIIEASLNQAEGGSVSDYPKIAEVIHNRLASGMHLQFDSTVLYGLGKYAVSATFKQINTPGPYNTYLNAGLPAGPISNPGDAAIQGVLHPAHGNWLYFLTVPNGKSQFSATPLKGQ
jgi:uncharacterized YceG family protein